MTNEVRQARLAGRLPKINFTEFAVLLIAADTCRGDSRTASLSMTELVNLSGQERTSMWRAVNKLADLGYLKKRGRGNQFQASRYEVLPGARCADATSTKPDARCADATSTEPEHVAFEGEHVAFEGEHVAFEAGARCGGATHPVYPEVTIPIDRAAEARAPVDPLGAGAATTGAELVKQTIPAEHPPSVRTMLRIKASELINAGTPVDDVAAALRLWVTKPNVGPGILPLLVSDVIKARTTAGNGQPAKKNKIRGYAELAAEVRAQEHLDSPIRKLP
jgi:hypothetical protein